MPGIKAVIFDMDGVLTDSEPVIEAAAIAGLREYGVYASGEDFKPFIGTGEDRYIGGVSEKYGVPYTTDMKKRVYEIYLEIVGKNLKVYDGTCTLIDKLGGAGILMAVASSADRVKIDANLSVAGISQDAFKAIISGEDVINKKPFPEIYEKASRAVGVSPQNCIVVEDALSGIRAAKAAGMRCIAVTTSFTEEILKNEKPDYIISSIGCVYSTVLRINNGSQFVCD